MSYLRFTIDGAVKLPLPTALNNALPDIKAKLQTLKAYCSKINAGQSNEENTIRFKYHICHHDEYLPCEPEQDI